ncbi:MAG: hypothetical protein IJ048_09300, partial [Clostridia bacterium]|nr:hypothetical protein [Clostridia bacterium]
MTRMSRLKSRMRGEARALGRDTGTLLAAAWQKLALFAALLLLPPQLGMRLGPEWLSRLSDFAGT